MGKGKKLSDKLAAAKRRRKDRESRPPSQMTGPSAGNLRRKMTRDHEDVLQNIESTLVEAYRNDEEVDDRVVYDALRAAAGGKPPGDDLAFEVLESLQAIREMREDVSNDVWNAALRVVMDSVKLHSERRPRETHYLDFVAPYIK